MYPNRYNIGRYEIKSTKYFSKWLSKLKDMKGRITVARRIERMVYGNFGDVKSVGTAISELRITTGPGLGGDKSTQSKDIEKSEKLLKEYENE